ncbi:DUF416 family protein [Rugamonas sp. CCM 8940]|uniref:DUF416 family protein n=1 Tax=Rugamonas sp. CCM 8940 TaxID=2765359 RepID=UPI0018F539FF|nr:DUF416 family protein [Rugamonas sp. CCM 8940]MBJ7309095.1 DUF416 family protein [Rugamonas sp. CCM 8940]
MYSFDEPTLVGELATLSPPQQVAFAAAAASRQLNSYEWYARRFQPAALPRPREIATALWQALQAGTTEPNSLSELLEEVMGLLPEESDDWIVCHSLAEDALSSLAYALRALLQADPQEAAWAARRGYEAVDQAAIRALEVQPGSPETELAIRCHPLVQRELERQRRDLAFLAAHAGPDAVLAMRNLAAAEPSLSGAELALLA